MQGLGLKGHIGTTRSADTFYARHAKTGSSFHNYWQSNWAHHFDDLKRLNVIAAEMEASIIFVLARVWGLRAGGIAVVMDNVCKVAGESGQFDPQANFDHSEVHIDNLNLAGCEAIRNLYEKDSMK